MSHEDLSRDRPAELGSDRTFGWVIAAALTIVGLWPLWRGGPPHLWPLAAALAFAAAALVAPNALRPLNRLWFALGLTLHKITNPIIMGILFFGVLLPIAIVFRLRGKDPLDLSFDKEANSYWIARSAPEGGSADMRKQF